MAHRSDTPTSTLGGGTVYEIDLKADPDKQQIPENRNEEGRAHHRASCTCHYCRGQNASAEQESERLSKRACRLATVYIVLVIVVMAALFGTIFAVAVHTVRLQKCPPCGGPDS